jgi:hypothetical protein
MSGEAKDGKGGGASQEAKLAAALRANLRRRKAAAREATPKPDANRLQRRGSD